MENVLLVVGRQNADIAPKGHWGRCHGNHIFTFYMWGAHCRHLVNTTEPSVNGSNAALCQITLTTCCYYAALQ